MCTRADLRIVARGENDFNVVYCGRYSAILTIVLKPPILRRIAPLLNVKAGKIKSVPRLRICADRTIDIYA